jgi:ribosomal protein S18 acetylase RimI-like enzyme
MSYAFRPMRIEDFEAAMQLWTSAAGVGVSVYDTREAIDAFLMRNPDLSSVSISEHDGLIATVLCGHDGRRGYLYHLAVSQEYRRRGIGRELVRRSLSGLKTCGIAKCTILTYRSNSAGRAFWDNIGWRERVKLRVFQYPLT